MGRGAATHVGTLSVLVILCGSASYQGKQGRCNKVHVTLCVRMRESELISGVHIARMLTLAILGALCILINSLPTNTARVVMQVLLM